jgi:hypothetical protein
VCGAHSRDPKEQRARIDHQPSRDAQALAFRYGIAGYSSTPNRYPTPLMV